MQGRKFTKGLRYNLPSTKPLASVVLQDTGDVSAALYIIPGGAHSDYEASARQLTEQSKMAAWFWYAGVSAMPTLPEGYTEPHFRHEQHGHDAYQDVASMPGDDQQTLGPDPTGY